MHLAGLTPATHHARIEPLLLDHQSILCEHREKRRHPLASHRKSVIKEVIERLDDRMALGESRGQAKEVAHARGQKIWAFTTGKIHSYKTRAVYQEQSLAFTNWVRSSYGLKCLELIEARADELVSAYLHKLVDEQKSPCTLQTVRSALRMLFGDRTLGKQVPLPRRTLSSITRSRGVVAHDHHFQPANWQPVLNMLRATGLRRDELKLLRVRDILEHEPDPHSPYYGQPVVKVWNGKGGKARTVPVLASSVQKVLAMKDGRAADEKVYLRIPKHLDVHSYRREYAQALYLSYAPGWALPPPAGRLKPSDYNEEAVQAVSRALGHNRKYVVLRHYLR